MLHPVVLSPRLLALPGSILRRPCDAVDLAAWDRALFRELVTEMLALQHRLEGVGLAAPQVGLSLRIAVIDDRQRPPLLLVNPTILHQSTETRRAPEGCLSLPGYTADVARADEITVRALNADGAPIEIAAKGALARILQHELDHLDGRLYVDHLASLDELRPTGPDALAERAVRHLFDGEPAPTPVPSCTPRHDERM